MKDSPISGTFSLMVWRRFIFLLLFLFSSCFFGIDRSGGILKYQRGVVSTGIGRFFVPTLPPPWKSPKISLKQLVHENDLLGVTIVTDALCGPKLSEAPLSRLAKDLFGRLQRVQLGKEVSFTLDGRTALRLSGRGSLEGVPIQMQVVVMKKNFCLYDFVYFSSPETFQQGLKDFDYYLYGFRTE